MTPAEARAALEHAELICAPPAVDAAVRRVADEINRVLAGDNPLVLCVLNGALLFAGRLLAELPFALEVDTIQTTRYGTATQGGELAFGKMPQMAVQGRTVLVVDDILDQGVTLRAIRDKLLSLGAQRVLIAVFAVKMVQREIDIIADFAGISVPDRYVFGFGMDVAGYWRNLPAVYALQP